MTIVFDLEPTAYPRMTRSDKWNKRDCVVKYKRFKNALALKALKARFTLANNIEIDFHIKIPKSRAKEGLEGKRHQQTPDLDNLIKSVLDALLANDSTIHEIKARKFWAKEPKVVIRQHEAIGPDYQSLYKATIQRARDYQERIKFSRQDMLDFYLYTLDQGFHDRENTGLAEDFEQWLKSRN